MQKADQPYVYTTMDFTGDRQLLKPWSATLSGDAEMDGYKAEVGGAASLPEQLFGDSYLQLSHADSGYVLRFDAVGALRQSLSDETPPVRVSHSRKWIQEREADVSSVGAQTLDYDWCAFKLQASLPAQCLS